MERNADECLNTTLNHTLKSSASSSVLTNFQAIQARLASLLLVTMLFMGETQHATLLRYHPSGEKNVDFPVPHWNGIGFSWKYACTSHSTCKSIWGHLLVALLCNRVFSCSSGAKKNELGNERKALLMKPWAQPGLYSPVPHICLVIAEDFADASLVTNVWSLRMSGNSLECGLTCCSMQRFPHSITFK